VGKHRASALSHAVNLALPHRQTRASGSLGYNGGNRKHSLSAHSRKYTIEFHYANLYLARPYGRAVKPNMKLCFMITSVLRVRVDELLNQK
jgi:hypothetical protein